MLFPLVQNDREIKIRSGAGRFRKIFDLDGVAALLQNLLLPLKEGCGEGSEALDIKSLDRDLD